MAKKFNEEEIVYSLPIYRTDGSDSYTEKKFVISEKVSWFLRICEEQGFEEISFDNKYDGRLQITASKKMRDTIDGIKLREEELLQEIYKLLDKKLDDGGAMSDEICDFIMEFDKKTL